MPDHSILLGGWRDASATDTFHAINPATGDPLPDAYPVSDWPDLDAALTAAASAAETLRTTPPAEITRFLNRFADRIEARADEITSVAAAETALPKPTRLTTIELPRTTRQLRLAAVAATDGSWALPTIDVKANIRSMHAPIGPVLIFGPNNFPLAFNAVSGGDFAAAIAAGNPVIAKGHPSHPGTTRLLAEEAFAAIQECTLPAATLQLIYHMEPATGLRAVADPRLGAAAFTGSRTAGLALKSAADAAGKPIYLEMSSLNPVLLLPGALRERGEKFADEYAASALAASGQFCTKPGLLLLFAGPDAATLLTALQQRFTQTAPGAMLSPAVARSLRANIEILAHAGAAALTGSTPSALRPAYESAACHCPNTLLHVAGAAFLANPRALQTEAFGNAVLVVVMRDTAQAAEILATLEGQLTGCIYSAAAGDDDQTYAALAPLLRRKVGRLLNDKMPTGVAVSPAMNHGGPYPATGHPGFTSVGIPASLRRFTQLECYDNVREDRLPPALRNVNPDGKIWRLLDGQWSRENAGPA